MEMQVEPFLLQFLQTNATESDALWHQWTQHRWCGKGQCADLHSANEWTRILTGSMHSVACHRLRNKQGRGQLRAGVVFFIDLITHREVCVCGYACTEVILHHSVMFKQECGDISGFYAVGLHLLSACLKVVTASIFPSRALEVKGTY